MQRDCNHDARWQRLAQAEVRAVMRALPRPLRERAADIAIELAEMPGAEAKGFSGTLLGLFHGESCERAAGSALTPTIITLYIANLRRVSGNNPQRFRSQVRLTLLHELGHFLGLNEEQVARRGL